jgi:hypothetical protein
VSISIDRADQWLTTSSTIPSTSTSFLK